MRDTEKAWYEAFLDLLLPTPETDEHGTSHCPCEAGCDKCVEDLLNDSQGG